MPFSEDLGVEYHQQDTSYYCGAACAQMVLDQIGAGLLDQDGLYADNHSHSTTEGGWYSGPDGVLWTMNHRKPASFGNYFVLYAQPNEDSISRKIIWTIRHYQVAPIAMVFGSAHWIVVRGYTASAAPKNSSDTSYSISAFDVNNPWPPTPSSSDPAAAPPPPHGGADGCGTGGDRGVSDEHISYTAWHDTYMTGVGGGHWAGTFLAVCDPEPPPDRVGTPGFVQHDRRSGERLLSSDDAIRRAMDGLAVYDLPSRKSYKAALQRAKPGAPVLVQRLDRQDTYYYVVPVRERAAAVPVAICVDARTGEYRESAVRPKGNVFVMTDPKKVARELLGRRLDLPDRLGRLLVRPEALCQYPLLVWKPCRESLSPYFPFHLFTAGDHHIYVRTDGAVFTQLHDADRGI